MVAQSCFDYLKTETLFDGYWRFCWLLRSIDCWWLVKRLTGLCWACGPNFQGQLKKLATEKSEKSTLICVQNWTYVVNTKEKRDNLIRNWDKTKYKLTSRNCDLRVQCHLEPVNIYLTKIDSTYLPAVDYLLICYLYLHSYIYLSIYVSYITGGPWYSSMFNFSTHKHNCCRLHMVNLILVYQYCYPT